MLYKLKGDIIMHKGKKLVCVLLVLAMIFALAACGSGGGQGSAKKEVTVGIQYDPATLTPWTSFTDGRITTLRSIYELLFDYECIGGKLLPCIGEKYELTAPRTYTVKIYDGVTDSAGNKITADDVVFSILSCKEQGELPQSHNNIESVEKVDDLTIKIVLNTDAAGAFENIVTNNYIVSKKAYEESSDGFASKPVGTGAYTVEEFTPASSLTLAKRSDYWQSADKTAKLSQANVEKITFKVIPETSSLVMALEGGDVDIAYFIPVSDISKFQNDKFNVTESPRDLAEVILFNCDASSPCADQKLRQAICTAIDNQVVLNQVFNGKGGLCKTFGSPIFGDYNKAWDSQEYYEFSVDKAKALVKESSYNGEKLKIMTDTVADHVKEAQIIQNMLSAVGIDAEIKEYDGALFNSNRFDPTTFDFYLTSKSSFDYVTSVWKFSFDQVTYKGQTVNFYKDSKLEEMLTKALISETHTEANIDAVHQYLKDIAIGYGMCYGVNLYASKTFVKSLTLDFKSRVVPGACEYDFSK